MELEKVVYNRNEEYFEGELWRREKFNNFKTGDYIFEYSTYENCWDTPTYHETMDIQDILDLLGNTKHNESTPLPEHKYPSLCLIDRVTIAQFKFNKLWR